MIETLLIAKLAVAMPEKLWVAGEGVSMDLWNCLATKRCERDSDCWNSDFLSALRGYCFFNHGGNRDHRGF